MCDVLRDLHHAKTYNFAKSNTLPLVFFTLIELCKWCEIWQNITFKGFGKESPENT